MKIISKFKDYYDYLSHVYGEDEKYAFNRKLLTDDVDDDSVYSIDSNKIDIPYMRYSRVLDKKNIEYFWMIVCGKLFFVYNKKISLENPEKKHIAYKKGDEFIEEFLPIVKPKNDRKKGYRKWKWDSIWDQRKQPEEFMGGYSEKYLDINIEYFSPICILLEHGRGFKCIPASPILGEVANFVSLYPDNQIYQDITYFLSNQVNGSPDLDPPVVLDDKYKIEYHGYTKESFRPKMREKNGNS